MNYSWKITVDQLTATHKYGKGPKHFNKRNQLLSEFLDRNRKNNVLVVGHPLNLDTNIQYSLKFKQPVTENGIFETNKQIPNSSVLFVENRGKWSAESSPTLPITHNFNYGFDWTTYQKKK